MTPAPGVRALAEATDKAFNRVMFSSATGKWGTPTDVYAALDAEFGFTLDPCPLDDAERIFEQDGLVRSWAGERVYCNPPYGRGLGDWLAKAREAEVAVYLLPARTDTRWWHDHAMHADEIRFLRGRLKFGGQDNPAPFPSCVLVYRQHHRPPNLRHPIAQEVSSLLFYAPERQWPYVRLLAERVEALAERATPFRSAALLSDAPDGGGAT